MGSGAEITNNFIKSVIVFSFINKVLEIFFINNLFYLIEKFGFLIIEEISKIPFKTILAFLDNDLILLCLLERSYYYSSMISIVKSSEELNVIANFITSKSLYSNLLFVSNLIYFRNSYIQIYCPSGLWFLVLYLLNKNSLKFNFSSSFKIPSPLSLYSLNGLTGFQNLLSLLFFEATY